MRQSVPRTLSAVLMFFVLILPGSFFGQNQNARKPSFRVKSHPREGRLRRGHSFHGDLRTLPQIPPHKFERPEREAPRARPTLLPGAQTSNSSQAAPVQSPPLPSAPAPAPSNSFDGLDYANWGAGHPPDTNGDVGPTYYIQTINTSVGVYNKSDATRVAAFTFNTLMSQGNLGNLCDTNNFGDPVVLYDTFEDRWIITDFAFQLDGSNNVTNPPGAFECFAVSKTGDPVAGGWNFSPSMPPGAWVIIRSLPSGPTGSTCQSTCLDIRRERLSRTHEYGRLIRPKCMPMPRACRW